MNNPWEEISLSEYRQALDSDPEHRTRILSAMKKEQLDEYPGTSVMVLGAAHGNGLEHVDRKKFKTVYGVDINQEYLQSAVKRNPHLKGALECICLDMETEFEKLPWADLVIANLVTEYIGYQGLMNVIRQVRPEYVTCILETDSEGNTGTSYCTKVFPQLERVSKRVCCSDLERALDRIGYNSIKTEQHKLPGGNMLVRIDFAFC